MANYKLYYFDARGFCETNRFLFAQAGVEYEDIRFTMEQWPPYKTKAPGGTAPYLELDGRKMGQSMAIARYLAREFGMYGNDSWDQGKIDEITDTYDDVKSWMMRIIFAKNEDEKTEPRERIPILLAGLETRLKDNNGGRGYYVGSNVSLADLKALAVGEMLIIHEAKNILDDTPVLKAHYERIAALPNIATWLENRPQTER